jgi:hypothetical protein
MPMNFIGHIPSRISVIQTTLDAVRLKEQFPNLTAASKPKRAIAYLDYLTFIAFASHKPLPP